VLEAADTMSGGFGLTGAFVGATGFFQARGGPVASPDVPA
jgi:hypothetical protein